MRWLGRISAVLSIFALSALVAPTVEAKPKGKAAAKHKPKIAPRDTRRGAKWKPKAKKGGGAGYTKHVKSWHDKEEGATPPKDAAGRPKLVLEAINVKETVELAAATDKGE